MYNQTSEYLNVKDHLWIVRWGHFAFGQSEALGRCCKGRCQQKLLQSCAFTSQGFEEMHSWVWFMWAHFSDSNSLWIWASKGFSNSRSNSLKTPNLTWFQLCKSQERVNVLLCFGYQPINHGVGVFEAWPRTSLFKRQLLLQKFMTLF